MLVKSTVIFALLCVVSGNVIINVFDNDGSDVKSMHQSLGSCSLAWCEQTCRNMGFPGGACVGDSCKCDILEESQTDAELKKQASMGMLCNQAMCERSCRDMGFRGGLCVGDTCECDLIKHTDVQSSVQNCNDWCNKECQSLNYSGGVCFGEDCYCGATEEMKKNTKIVDKSTDMQTDAQSSLHACKDWCDDFCKEIGNSGGSCDGETCYCNSLKNIQKLTKIVDKSTDKQSVGRVHLASLGHICMWSECNQGCIRMGYARGQCIGNDCKCSSYVQEGKTDNDINANVSEEDISESNIL